MQRNKLLCRDCESFTNAPADRPAHGHMECRSTIVRPEGELLSFVCSECGAPWMCFRRRRPAPGCAAERWERVER